MRLSVTAALVFLPALLASSAASAHATLVSSDPADGAVIATAPAQLTLTFNEPVSALAVRLVGAEQSVSLPNPPDRAASLVVPAPAALARGTHVLSWRVISLDGHPVGGTVVFSIGEPSAQTPAAAADSDRVVAAAFWLAKLVLYFGLFFGIGGGFFLAWLRHDRGGARPTAIALSAGLAATPLAVGLQGADALGLPLAGLFHPAVWRTGFNTSFGLTAVAAALALFAGLLALTFSMRLARGLSLAGILGAGLALALSGHASAAEPQWLTRPLVFIHAVTVTFWVGALLPLRAALRGDDGIAVLARFSAAIPWAIVPLIASGIILAIVQVGALELLLTTAYGRVLCAKLLLVAALLALAAWNRYRVTAALAARRSGARHALDRSIRLEVAIVAAVLALVATWRFTPPPRALAIAANRPALLHIHTAQAMADVQLEPGHAGIARASIVIMTGDFGGLDAKEVQLTLDNKPAGIEAISRPATKGADAVWRVERFPIPQDGRWEVQVDILVNDFEKITLDGQIDLPPR